MPIEMPKGLPFSVDTWSLASRRKRHHFLTHAHKDHLVGAASYVAGPIYATAITKTISCRCFPQLEDAIFVEIEVGKPVVVNDPDGDFNVTAFDANHCMGAVMFLFEGPFGNLLHTGDCRLTPDCLQSLPIKYITKKERELSSHLDYLFLDCTFGRCSLDLPSKKSAIQQVINCIWKHPNAPVVYLACDLLGQEEILVEVSKTFGSKIYIDKTNNSEFFFTLSLTAPEILSDDTSSRFQVIEGFPRLYERANEKLREARANLQPDPLFIRPSVQWYAGIEHLEMTKRPKPALAETEKDEFGIWHVCYSMHSSRGELESALQFLQPKWVISTTLPCRAMELDYVKKHCFKTQMTADDPLWKLLKVSPRKSISTPSSTASKGAKDSGTSALLENQLEPKKPSTEHLELKLDLVLPSRARPVTLFGRARLGVYEPDDTSLEVKKPESIISDKVIQETASLEADETQSLQQRGINELITEEKYEESDVVERDTSSCVGSSKSLSGSLRKLYRSMNVPVPRPLPSLVDLMNVSKRARIESVSILHKISDCNHSLEHLS
ncbi:hypothetical protein J5N97_020055 [Dioscorea zingiberensis]|uniref:DNA repair metallo-beta-lactamase domain-containing protein n=1 Tax=Dioscorea zingiberensis TaxID=325984 RepID=A0A9D5CF24_9LILI|nr:hypothetical protein J5N97_020055 [Dioscorea zingiberensis]